jgi:hypothetical protein
MPNKVKVIKVIKQRMPAKNGKKKRSMKSGRGRSGRRGPAIPRSVADVMHVILDPCGGPLVTALATSLPGQLVERVRNTYSIPIDPTAFGDYSNGYIVWFPSYHNDGYTDLTTLTGLTSFAGNCFVFGNASSSLAPDNTGITAVLRTTGAFVEDPANSLLTSTSPFSRAQTVSACLQLDYTGSLSNLKGQVAVVQNYSLAEFIRNSGATSATTPAFPSVDQVFSYASKRERMPLEGTEVIWRPSTASSIMRTNGSFGDGASLTFAGATIPDACLYRQAANPCYPVATDPNSVKGICIAWKGAFSATSGVNLSFNLIKVVSVELAARSSMIESIPHGVALAKTAFTPEDATNWLDANMTGWQSSITDGMKSMSLGKTGNALAAGGMVTGAATMSAINSSPFAFRRLLSTITNGGTVFNSRGSIADRV